MKKSLTALAFLLLLLSVLSSCKQAAVPLSDRRTFSSQEEMISFLEGTWCTSAVGSVYHYLVIDSTGTMSRHLCGDNGDYVVWELLPTYVPEKGVIQMDGKDAYYVRSLPLALIYASDDGTIDTTDEFFRS